MPQLAGATQQAVAHAPRQVLHTVAADTERVRPDASFAGEHAPQQLVLEGVRGLRPQPPVEAPPQPILHLRATEQDEADLQRRGQ